MMHVAIKCIFKIFCRVIKLKTSPLDTFKWCWNGVFSQLMKLQLIKSDSNRCRNKKLLSWQTKAQKWQIISSGKSATVITVNCICAMQNQKKLAGVSTVTNLKHIMLRSKTLTWDGGGKGRKENRGSRCVEKHPDWRRKVWRESGGVLNWIFHRQNLGMTFQEITFTLCKRLPDTLKLFPAEQAQEIQAITKVIFKEITAEPAVKL